MLKMFMMMMMTMMMTMMMNAEAVNVRRILTINRDQPTIPVLLPSDAP